MGKETALVTGASSGIGLELARGLAAAGYDLVLSARRLDKLETLAAELSAAGAQVRVLPADLAAVAAPGELERQLAEAGVTVDLLVNNAGFGAQGTVAALTLARQLEMIQVNVTSLTELTRRLLPGMIARGRGGILNVASTAGFQPGPNMSVYYATKAYVLSFSEGLIEELRGTGVRVTCLCPGPTHTGFVAEAGLENTALFNLGAMDAARVARAGVRGVRRGTAIVVPGLLNKLGILGTRLSPRWLVRKVTRRLNS